MCEGHNLWRSWWQAKERNVVRGAWAVTTAAASFTWSDLGKRSVTCSVTCIVMGVGFQHPPYEARKVTQPLPHARTVTGNAPDDPYYSTQVFTTYATLTAP